MHMSLNLLHVNPPKYYINLPNCRQIPEIRIIIAGREVCFRFLKPAKSWFMKHTRHFLKFVLNDDISKLLSLVKYRWVSNFVIIHTIKDIEFKQLQRNSSNEQKKISLMENWLVIYVINSRPLLVLYSLFIYFSQSWRFILKHG